MSDSEDFGIDSEDAYSSGDMEVDDADYGFDPAEDVDVSSRRAAYEILTEQQLRERQAESVGAVTSVLGITDGEAARVLRHYKWDPNRVNDEYFADMDRVRDKLGLMDDSQPSSPVAAAVAAAGTAGRKVKARPKKVLCGICYEEFPADSMLAAPCHHAYCTECWHGYVSTAIASGPACLDLRCPDPECKVAVPDSVLRRVLHSGEEAKLDQFAMRSFVEDNRWVAWCPAPGCGFAVQCSTDAGQQALDIACKCGSTFCFACKEEAHRPVDCGTVAKWLLKNSAESENLNWIMANTKPCPKCKRPIEKNHGCMHMNCSQCRHEFCWLCLGDWKAHGEGTGGFYACNRYEQGKKEGKYNEEEAKRERAKQSLERYMHYYQRFAEHDKARKQATAKMTEFAEAKIEQLSNITATPTSQLKLVLDAWAQVTDCRRILKWTYAYGFYHFGDEGGVDIVPLTTEQQAFFEFQQGQAESYLEKLHRMVETDMSDLLDGTRSASDWPAFRETLIGLTDVTQSHFAKLVNELEKGMNSLLDTYRTEEPAEEAAAAAPAAAAAEPAAPEPPAPSSAKKGGASKRSRRTHRGGGSSQLSSQPAAGASSQLVEGSALEAMAGYWACPVCTYANELGAAACEMCETARAP